MSTQPRSSGEEPEIPQAFNLLSKRLRHEVGLYIKKSDEVSELNGRKDLQTLGHLPYIATKKRTLMLEKSITKDRKKRCPYKRLSTMLKDTA